MTAIVIIFYMKCQESINRRWVAFEVTINSSKGTTFFTCGATVMKRNKGVFWRKGGGSFETIPKATHVQLMDS